MLKRFNKELFNLKNLEKLKRLGYRKNLFFFNKKKYKYDLP